MTTSEKMKTPNVDLVTERSADINTLLNFTQFFMKKGYLVSSHKGYISGGAHVELVYEFLGINMQKLIQEQKYLSEIKNE